MAHGTVWASALCLVTLNLAMALSFAMVSNPLLARNNPKLFHAPQDPDLSSSMFGGEEIPSPATMEQRIGLGDSGFSQGEGERLRGLKRGDLVEDCVRKARLVYYRSQVSQDQPEFVRVCKMMWKKWVSAKSPDLQFSDLKSRGPMSLGLKSLDPKSSDFGTSDLKSAFLKRSNPAIWAKWANRALRMNSFLNHNSFFVPRRLFYRVRVADEKRAGHSEGLAGRINKQDKQDSRDFDGHFYEVGLPNAHNRPTKIRESSGHDNIANDVESSEAIRSTFTDMEPDVAESRFRMKRSPWAGSENRYNVLDMLRSRLHARGKKYVTAHASTDLQRLSAITAHALRRLKRSNTMWYPEVDQERGYGYGYGFVPEAARSPQGKRSPRPSERHPFVGGLGDYAAEMALQTYAQLLQNQINNESRLGEGADKTTRNARPFIG